MKLLKFSIFFIFFAITDIFAEDIKVIELHPFDNDEEYQDKGLILILNNFFQQRGLTKKYILLND